MHPHHRRLLITLLPALVLAAVTLLLTLLPAAAGEQHAPAPGAVTATPLTTTPPITLTAAFIAGGFSSPTDITHAGDERLFVVEQTGRIKIVKGQRVNAAPFLDLSATVTVGIEAGLLGLAFAPDYATSGHFYVYFVEEVGGQVQAVLARFTVSADPDVADPASRTDVLVVKKPALPNNKTHNGGDLNFGPDGYLYLGLGDGAYAPGGGDPLNNAQNPDTLLGKVVRLDVSGVPTYTIPTDNPFAGDAGVRDEIWALGFRNPWRASFDRLSGDFWIADVGQFSREEINFQPASSSGGENYGWRCYEGSSTYDTGGCGPSEDYIFPVFDYDHVTGRAVTGGFVYRGQNFGFLEGRYVFSDFNNGRIWTISPDGGGGWIVDALPPLVPFPSTFGENAAGELYVAAYYLGEIYQVQERRLTVDLTDFIFLPGIAVGGGAPAP